MVFIIYIYHINYSTAKWKTQYIIPTVMESSRNEAQHHLILVEITSWNSINQKNDSLVITFSNLSVIKFIILLLPILQIFRLFFGDAKTSFIKY